ncbi:phosphate ABC transporter substrate-binding protein [Pseudoclavibacter endophyticus]|uniref:PstS family phosphate ABC transporter substrate-binding protein n=1 Tax=Pseudoclavibacter endophyticus TaxID=1778590 RepID=A0A6H9WF97_9MICO|nr:PstS family phosphate ABC transporter substrate-binding protein [Pseudoclavibacter endophyticus]KAB1646798.1 PstS family phosphate ABC transporter substrate-binding protein [Pseudoclavibacter endophyticus]GGA75451.1 phosphate ABC transporter substrate-binding protein [Pseudoclavibacter endophyticus]
MTARSIRIAATSFAALAALTGCATAANEGAEITVSGSATVAPITQAVADQGRFAIDLAAEGTINGFERFCAGETDLNNASTAIPEEFVASCAENGVDFVELPIGLDAMTLVRNEANSFATDLSMTELADIWAPDSTVTTWADVRSEWPDDEIGLYGRPDGSGTFDFFTNTVNGEPGSIRDDYQATNDMVELTSWVADDENALAFMGVGNYLEADEEQRDRITNIAIDGVMPTLEHAQSGEYTPFSRPLFIYVSLQAIEEKAAVAEFVDYYVDYVPNALPFTGFYGLGDEVTELVQARWEARTPGAMFDGDEFPTGDLAAALSS